MSSGTPRDVSRSERLLVTLEGLLGLDALEARASLNQAAQQLVSTLDADKIDIFVYEAESETLVALGISDTPMGRRQVQIGLDRQPLANDGRAVEVYETGQSFFSGQVADDQTELRGMREGLGVRSEIIAPLDIAGQRRGVLAANSATPEHFTEEDLRFLEAVARWVGMVLHRAELTEQLARQAEARGRLAAFQDLFDQLTPREQDVAAFVALGLSTAEIAERLVITEGTVANHIRHILLKMNAPNRARVAAIVAHLKPESLSRDGASGSNDLEL